MSWFDHWSIRSRVGSLGSLTVLKENWMTIFVGDDWAEDHHDVHVMNEAGVRLASRRLPEGLAGIEAFHQLVAPHATDPGEVIVGTETEHGMWVTALVASGYQ